MEQLVHNLKDGQMQILEVPAPALGSGQILVKNHFSLISAGTEGKRVKDAKLGYISKAKSRQKEVKQVFDSIKNQGVMTTYRVVMNKLNAYSTLGYSCAGEVIEIGDDVTEFQVGDRVACGGNNAVHGEVVVIPKNLCVKVPEKVDLKHASFTTIASIALQGIRQADLRLGENCAVIGLGLLGLLTVQLLKAGGIKVVGFDLEKRQVDLATKCGADMALESKRSDSEAAVLNITNGFGVDAVIITAATSSQEPINFAGKISRQKGRVIVVGAVSTGFDREYYYKKELELRMSTSYGPGRYDPQYEDRGVDYPIGYVRWTENRNMQAFVDFLNSGAVNMDVLISHTFDFDKASEAYGLIVNKSEPFAGVLLRYETDKKISKQVQIHGKSGKKSELTLGFIGAGSFAQNFLLPNVKQDANLIGVATARSNTARNIAEKFGFQYCTGDAERIINDKNISTVFIATRHNLHAEYVLKALDKGKNVFVEKPLALTKKELREIEQSYAGMSKQQVPQLMVGFNRRFSPQIQRIKKVFSDTIPKAITYRINAGIISSDHWTHDRQVGGGRIIGEVCHFIDLAMFLSASPISSISAKGIEDGQDLWDTLVINLGFANGSIAAISYFSNGNKSIGKEYLEVYCGGQVAILDDFKRMTMYQGSNKSTFNLGKQDKGHDEEIKKFLESIKNGRSSPIPVQELFQVTNSTFLIWDSLKQNKTISI